MALQVVGAGLGRTGTLSLKTALERLLGDRCYHMVEVFQHPKHVTLWREAAQGAAVDLHRLLSHYVATVDWPACALWRRLADDNPRALILLSTRSSAEAWWTSASRTIFVGMDDRAAEPVPGWRAMWDAVTDPYLAPAFYRDQTVAMAAYDAHNAAVRAEADPARLVEWQPGDGWEPLCTALDLAVPDEPFPHLNTTEEWLARRPPP